MSTFLVFIVLFILPAQSDCREWRECRQRAIDAAALEDYETFHDFAWRAVQTGPTNDPALMHLLARAQSLSGRPHDALVMLRRLAGMHVATDAATSEDFRRVRALAGWADLEAELAALTPDSTAAPPKPEIKPAPSASTPARPGVTDSIPARLGAASTAAAAVATVAARLMPGETVAPAGLSYDAISKRFIIGDSVARKLKVVDEFSQQIATLAGEEAAGFGDITAIEIDSRQGDLWVASAGFPGEATTTIHKLQLVSARLLEAFRLPPKLEPGRFTDVAVTSESTVLLLDDLGGRVFRLRPRSRTLELAATIDAAEVTSIAPAGAMAYVAHLTGLARVDLASGVSAPVRTSATVDLARLTRIRWHRGSLIAIQRNSNASSRVVRIRLDRTGRTAVGVEVLDPQVRMTDVAAAAITHDVFYYLTAEGAESVIRRIAIK